MKKTTKILLMITFFLLLLAGCAEKINLEAQLAGKWYSEGDITSCREGIVIIGERYMTTHGELIEPMVPEN